MKKILSLLLIATLSNITIAQTTAIPDSNFEQYLIDQGYDSGIPDGVILTSNVDTIKALYVAGLSITNLIGIEDFTALEVLICANNQLTTVDVTQNSVLVDFNCFNNQLTSLDVTQNTMLKYLYCNHNLLTSLDVSQNTALEVLHSYTNSLTTLDVTQNTALVELKCLLNLLTTLDVTQNTALEVLHCYLNLLTTIDLTQNIGLIDLYCSNNQLTTLDLTQNTTIYYLNCSNNQLTSLDLTQNTAVVSLNCSNNQLTCLNLKSGNNTNVFGIHANQNPSLTCIQVDNISYSTNNWTGNYFNFDPQTSFNINCGTPCSSTTVGIEKSILSNLSLYPNPTTGNFTIDLGEFKQDVKATLTNSLGQVILTKNYTSTNSINLDIETPIGIYFLRLESKGEVITKKVIKE